MAFGMDNAIGFEIVNDMAIEIDTSPLSEMFFNTIWLQAKDRQPDILNHAYKHFTSKLQLELLLKPPPTIEESTQLVDKSMANLDIIASALDNFPTLKSGSRECTTRSMPAPQTHQRETMTQSQQVKLDQPNHPLTAGPLETSITSATGIAERHAGTVSNPSSACDMMPLQVPNLINPRLEISLRLSGAFAENIA